MSAAASASAPTDTAVTADKMMACMVREFGGPEKLEWMQVDMPTVGDNQALVRIQAAGVNFIDTYGRRGLPPYNKAGLPMPMGREGAGVVERVGKNVQRFAVGDRVAFAMVPGAYAEFAAVSESQLVRVPDDVSLNDAAAALLQGLTTHYLVKSTFELRPQHTCLVHAASGGVGRLLVQWAKHIGARVIGTVSSDVKAQEARANGCDHVIVYTAENFVDALLSFTGGKKVDVVYDSVGKDTFDGSLKCLKSRGMLVLFGQSSGAVAPVDPQVLSTNGSLYLTRPTLGHYTETVEELEERAADLFAGIRAGWLKLHVCETVPMDEAWHAHQMLEERRTVGKVLLVPRS